MAQEKKRGEVEIDLLQLMKALWRNAWLIILVTLVAALAGRRNAAAGFVPQYTADVKFAINTDMTGARDGDYITSQELDAAQDLVFTYEALLKTRTAQQAVAEQAGFASEPSALGRMVSVAAIDSTQLIRVSVTSPDPEEARRVADAIAAVLPPLAERTLDGSSIRLVDAAQLPASASVPAVGRGTAMGALLGFVLSCLAVVVMALLDRKIRERTYLEKAYPETPVLGDIPRRDGRPGKGYSVGEAYALLGDNLLSALGEADGCRAVGVTSPLYGEGCDEVVLRLGEALSAAGKKTLVVDADLSRPSAAESLGLPPGPGLAEALAGEIPAEEALTGVGTPVKYWVLPAGNSPGERLDAGALEKLMKTLRPRYDCIILRLPPVGTSADALRAADVTDGLLMAVRLGRTSRRTLAGGMDLAAMRHIRTLGFVLTRGKAR